MTRCADKIHIYYRYIKGNGGMKVVPSYLVERDWLPLERGVARQFWLTVRPPADAAPGQYRATVTVTAGGGRAQFPLEVEVYPFKLESVAACGLIYAHKLLALIAKARKRGTPATLAAAATASKTYAAILARIRIGTAGGTIQVDGRTDDMGDYCEQATYDRFRAAIAGEIIAIKRLLAGGK